MKRLACVLILLCFASSVMAEDWLGIIKQLKKEPRNKETNIKIATCYNQLGREHYHRNDWSNAEKYFLEAIQRMPSETAYKENLALVYLQQAGDLWDKRASRSKGGSMHRRAKLLAQRALGYDPKLAGAHVLIGRIEYDNQKISAAKKALRKAQKLDPSIPGLNDFISKVEREAAVEQKFEKTTNSFFELRYNGKNIDKKTAKGLRLAMDVARQHIGRDFTFRPKHKIIVLIYSSKTYAGLRIGPHWSAGLYDGKIRLPLDGQENLDQAVATLFHEYTHALLDDLAGGKCPRWLNEGLAEVQEQKIAKKKYYVLPIASQSKNLIPLDSLDSAFQSRDTMIVTLGYEQARSVAQYIVDKYGYRRLKRVLARLADNKPIEIALRESLNVRLDELDCAWRESLPNQLTKSKKGKPKPDKVSHSWRLHDNGVNAKVY